MKIYLDASAEERARRRFNEITERGANVNFEDILAKVNERDLIDSTRDVAPLKPAADAIIVDSDKLTAEDVFNRVLGFCR